MGYVVHDQVHLYVSELTYSAERELRDRLHAEPVKRGGNLHVLIPYYGPAIRYGAHDEGEMSIVSDVQLFLDLVHFPVRGPEAAGALLRKRMRRRLRLSSEDIDSLGRDLGL